MRSELSSGTISELQDKIASLTEQVKIAEEALKVIAKEELLFEHEGSPSSKRSATIAKNKVFKALSKIKAIRAKGETGSA